MAKQVGKIEDETPILPWVVAECVVDEIVNYFGKCEFDRSELKEYLKKRAQDVYEKNDEFRDKIGSTHGSFGRNTLYAFMRHWSAGWIKTNLGHRMPYEFCNGIKLNHSLREMES